MNDDITIYEIHWKDLPYSNLALSPTGIPATPTGKKAILSNFKTYLENISTSTRPEDKSGRYMLKDHPKILSELEYDKVEFVKCAFVPADMLSDNSIFDILRYHESRLKEAGRSVINYGRYHQWGPGIAAEEESTSIQDELSDKEILKIASDPSVTPVLPYQLEDTVTVGVIREQVLRFARALLEAHSKKGSS